MAGLATNVSRRAALYAVVGAGACLILSLLTLLLWLCRRRRIRQQREEVEEEEKAVTGMPPSPKNRDGMLSTTNRKQEEEDKSGGRRRKGGGDGEESGASSEAAGGGGGKGGFFSDASKSRSVSRVDLSSNSLMTTEEDEEDDEDDDEEERSSVPSISPSEVSFSQQLGCGRRFSLRDLEMATALFSDSCVLGRGGYGVVYHGVLPDGTSIAAKKLVGNRGQAEHEFKVEVEAIGRVRHKHLVCLLGYCIEGPHRILVYEYVDNGTLDQWLHGPLASKQPLPWKHRMQIILGTAKALAYLHEGLEPKVVHRDIKSSNILLDRNWNAKISDFGLAKLLGPEHSHVTTRVMGTFGYVAPEYANTGLLNEKSDVYSYGVLLMELITGREPVDYCRPQGEVNVVDWLKTMVGNRQADVVSDPRMVKKPSLRSLKRALLVSLRCVDPDAEKRPKMSHVIHMLEAADDNSFHERTQYQVSSHTVSSKEASSSNSRRKESGFPKSIYTDSESGSDPSTTRMKWTRYGP